MGVGSGLFLPWGTTHPEMMLDGTSPNPIGVHFKTVEVGKCLVISTD